MRFLLLSLTLTVCALAQQASTTSLIGRVMDSAGAAIPNAKITAQGPHMVVVLNGTKTVDAQNSKHSRGAIGLQYGAGVVKFRLVQIKAL